MLAKEMVNVVECALAVSHRRARTIVGEFMRQYKGYKDAISAVDAEFTPEGRIKFTYIINQQKQHIIL